MASYDCVRCSPRRSASGDGVRCARRSRSSRRTRTPTRLGVFDDLEWFGDHDATRRFDRTLDHARALGCRSPRSTRRRSAPRRELLYGSTLVAERTPRSAVRGHASRGDGPGRRRDRAARAASPSAPRCSGRSGPSPPCRRRDRADLVVGRRAPPPHPPRVPTVAESVADAVRPRPGARSPHRFVNPLGLATVRGAVRRSARRACPSACRSSDPAATTPSCSRWRHGHRRSRCPVVGHQT